METPRLRFLIEIPATRSIANDQALSSVSNPGCYTLERDILSHFYKAWALAFPSIPSTASQSPNERIQQYVSRRLTIKRSEDETTLASSVEATTVPIQHG